MPQQQKNEIRFALLFFVLTIFISPTFLWSAEHPSEHPTEPPSKKTAAVTKEALSVAIENYVKEQAKIEGGYFLFYDAREDKALALTLDKVHKDRLSRIKDDVYFACADFRANDGTMYDLDIFMKGESPAQLKVTAITLHKKNGKARYIWVQERGLWKREKK